MLSSDDYKFHPRILELRLTLTYDILLKAFGSHQANDIMKHLVDTFDSDEDVIKSVMMQHTAIMRMHRYDFLEFRIQAVLMGMAWGEKRSYVGKVYLNGTNVMDKKYRPSAYVNEYYYDQLTKQVRVLKSDKDINIVKNFLINIDMLFRLFR